MKTTRVRLAGLLYCPTEGLDYSNFTNGLVTKKQTETIEWTFVFGIIAITYIII